MSEQSATFGRWSAVPVSIKKKLAYSFYLTTLITLISTALYFLVQPEIPLFYTLPQEHQALAPKIWLAVFPSISFLVTLIHMIALSFFYDLEELLQNLFATTTLAIQALLLLALVRILLVTF